MPVNVEIKAHVEDLDALRERVRALAGGDASVLRQEDTFFLVPSGRLKLRVIDGEQGELIYYDRGDEPGPTPSEYLISPVADPEALKSVLTAAFGVRGIVRKTRELFIVGRTRVHLDDVEGLGAYMELEVVLEPQESPERGCAEAQELLEALLIQPGDLADRAYIDLVEARVAVANVSRDEIRSRFER